MTEHLIRNEWERNRVMEFLQKMPLDKGVLLELKPIKTTRSVAQNNLLWKWNNCIQAHMADHYGEQASADEWHEIMVSKLWPAELHVVQLPDGDRFRVGRAKTRKFTVRQMTEYLGMLDAYCAESLGLLLPHPMDLMMAIWGEDYGRAGTK